jgi:hypothetical protein
MAETGRNIKIVKKVARIVFTKTSIFLYGYVVRIPPVQSEEGMKKLTGAL